MFSRHSSMSQPMTTWKGWERATNGSLRGTNISGPWEKEKHLQKCLFGGICWFPGGYMISKLESHINFCDFRKKCEKYPEDVCSFMNILCFILEDIPIMPSDSKCYQIDFFHALPHLNDSSTSHLSWCSQNPVESQYPHMTSISNQSMQLWPWQSQCPSSPSPHVPWRTPWCSPGTNSRKPHLPPESSEPCRWSHGYPPKGLTASLALEKLPKPHRKGKRRLPVPPWLSGAFAVKLRGSKTLRCASKHKKIGMSQNCPHDTTILGGPFFSGGKMST